MKASSRVFSMNDDNVLALGSQIDWDNFRRRWQQPVKIPLLRGRVGHISIPQHTALQCFDFSSIQFIV
jgi:hypothetical protein